MRPAHSAPSSARALLRPARLPISAAIIAVVTVEPSVTNVPSSGPNKNRGLPVALRPEAVAVGHEALDGEPGQLAQAVEVLKLVNKGELPFDRTVQVSVTDKLEKDQILGRLPHNLRTLEILLKRNRKDYLTALGKSNPRKKREAAWKRLSRRRRRAS